MLQEQYKFEDSLLIATKKCTHERNMHYKTGLATWLVHNNVTMCIQTGGQNKQKLIILYAYLKYYLEVLVVAIIVARFMGLSTICGFWGQKIVYG